MSPELFRDIDLEAEDVGKEGEESKPGRAAIAAAAAATRNYPNRKCCW